MPRLLLALAPLFLITACGDGAQECLDDRTCGAGNRCVLAALGEQGECAPCAATETPYDGQDNDCNGATRDRDVDGDRDDAVGNGGNDCDDNDPAVSSKTLEVCEDGKDNDCDGTTDEIDCRDHESPEIALDCPSSTVAIVGSFEIEAFVQDDVGVVSAVLSIDDAPVGTQPYAPPLTADTIRFQMVDTQRFLDGPHELSLELTDVAGKHDVESCSITFDNYAGPAIQLVRPNVAISRGGRVTIEAAASDISGVESVTIAFGSTTTTATVPPFSLLANTHPLPDGPAIVTITAVDRLGHINTNTATITVDNTAPTVTFTKPTAGAPPFTGYFDVSVLGEDPAGIAVISSGGVSTSTRSTLNYRIDGELIPTPTTLMATARDRAVVDEGMGANTGTGTVVVRVSNPGRVPNVTIESPTTATVFGLTQIDARAVSPLAMVGIARIEIFVDQVKLPVTGTNPAHASYDFLLHPEATAVIEARAFDNDGRVGQAWSTVTLAASPHLRIASQRLMSNGFSSDGYDVGDVTGDGIADVVAGGSVLQLLTGHIKADLDWIPLLPVVLDTAPANGPDRVRLIDADADLDLDLITQKGGLVMLYLNDGGLPGAPSLRFAVPGIAAVEDFEVGDLDADGDLDVVLAGGGANVDAVVLHNVNNAAFTYVPAVDRLTSIGSVSDLALADVNADQTLDLVLGRRGGSAAITIYLNDGSGIFGTVQNSSTPGAANYVAVGDVTGDSIVDVVAVVPTLQGVTPAAGGLVVMTGDSSGLFDDGTPVRLPAGSREVLLEDLNEDDRLDAIVNTSGPNTVQELFNQGGGLFPAPGPRPEFVIAADPIQPLLVDLDGDGDLDYLAIGAGTPQTLAFAENLGGGNLHAAAVITPEAPPRAIASGDVSGIGGEADFVVAFNEAGPTPARVAIGLNSAGVISMQSPTEIGQGITIPTSIAVGDLDGVGPLDITVGSNGSGPDPMTGDRPAVALLNQGGSTPILVHLPIIRPADTVIADVDGDGVGEALFTTDDSDDGAEIWKLDSGAGVYLDDEINGDDVRAIAAGDLVGQASEYVDFVVAYGAPSNAISLSWWNGTIWNHTNGPAVTGVVDVATFLGSNPFGDILVLGASALGVIPGDGFGGFGSPNIIPISMSALRLLTGDFNDDGQADVIVLHGNNRMSLLIATPPGSPEPFFAPFQIPLGDGPVDFTTADFNSDQFPDLAIACTTIPAVIMVYSAPP